MLSAHGLADATDVVVSGCSAGGLATFLNCDRWASAVHTAAGPTAKVRCLPDSAMFLDHQDPLAASDAAAFEHPGFHDALVWAFEAMEMATDSSCLASYEAAGEQWRCAFAQHLWPHIETPTYVINSKFDSWSLLASGGGTWAEDIGGIFLERDPAVINAEWGVWFDEAIRVGLAANAGHGAFVTSCGYHCSLWTTTRIADLTPAEAFALWYSEGAQALPSRLLADGAAFPCPECCSTDICLVGPDSGSLAALVPETAPTPPLASTTICANQFGAGLHKIVHEGRQFLLAVPSEMPEPPSRVPVVID